LVDTLELKIDSEDPHNQVGEIMVRGENLMYGYYKNKEATNSAIDEDGWLHTGDLGITDEDDFIYIKGRSKSLILEPSGENIYPEEIEVKINNMPYVQESVVLDKDNRILALVYPDYEQADTDNITESDLLKIMEDNKKEVNKQLPKFMQIASISIHPTEFEKTPKRSIKRYLYAAKA